MCKEPRVFSTSFRYSGDVANVMENIDCKTFADKFEFIVLDYKENKNKRDAYIKKLDKEILDKQNQLDKIKNELNKYSNIAEKAKILESAIIALTDKCNT